MRDQPFKRHFPSQKKLPKQSSKYPTYQHYYQHRISQINPITNIKQTYHLENRKYQMYNSPNKKDNTDILPQNKKQNKNNLKTQLQHLKNQVYRIMQKKQGILRSPIDTKLTIQKQRQSQIHNIQQSDNQSVSSQKIFGDTKRKLELKKSTQNYDYSKYIQLQNNLLKTQLRNLKNRYVNKKRQLTQKCQGLQQKIHFLEIALIKSQQSLAEEVTALKQTIRQNQLLQKQQNIPTSDKDDTSIIDNYKQQINKLTIKNNQLLLKLQKQQYNNFEQIINEIKNQYQLQIKLIQQQLLEIKNNNKIQIDNKNNEIKNYQIQNNNLKLQLQNVNKKIQLQNIQAQQSYKQYLKTIQLSQIKHQQLITNLQKQLQCKILTLSPKKSNNCLSQTPTKINNEITKLTNEIKRWKVQYKILKQKYESYIKIQNNSKLQIKQLYRTSKDSKYKLDSYYKKNQILQKQFNKYKNYLIQKDNLIAQKQINIINNKNKLLQIKNKYQIQIQQLKQQYKIIQQKLLQINQKYNKQILYRKQIQQQILQKQLNNQQIKQIIIRIKKRLQQQDQKIIKYNKQIKNKDHLISKLKLQVRQYMENTSNQQLQQSIKQIKLFYQTQKQSQQSIISCLEHKINQQKNIFTQLHQKYILQLQKLKQQNYNLNISNIDLKNEIKLISHSYNTKIQQIQSIIQNKQFIIQNLTQKIKQIQFIYNNKQNILKQQINIKNQQINILRKQVISKYISINTSNHNTFDQILKNQMQSNNKLKQQSQQKLQQIYKLRDNLIIIKSNYQNLKSQYQINKLKFLSQKKNIQVTYQTQIQNNKNNINNLQKKLLSLEHKLNICIQQNKKKDQFIQKYIIGKKLNQNQKSILENFMKQYSINLGNINIIQKLSNQIKQIQKLQKYNQYLIKQISQLKQKLILFQTIDIDKISLYQSILSKQSHQSIDLKQQILDIEVSQSKLKKTISLQDFTLIQNQL